MNIRLKGHDYKYAVEQIMLMLFPDERPEYTDKEPTGECCVTVSLSKGRVWTTAVTKLTALGKTVSARSRVKSAELDGKLAEDRLCQKIIKLSFFNAASELTGKKPEWGALTGIRPGKIAAGMMLEGATPRQAASAITRTYFVTPKRAELCVSAAEYGLHMRRALEPRDICLYVGIPFCPTRCAYCSFVSSSVERSMKLVEPFLNALYAEIEATARVVSELGLRVVSLYIGGGTPTTLTDVQLASLISKLRGEFDLTELREFTVEAGRPDTITPAKLHAMINGGVTRVSINPQTMEKAVLDAIGRRHTPEDTVRAYYEARDAGFANINMDMIAGLPADTADGFKRSLDTVLGLAPENITVHTLSLKRGTRITLEGTKIPDGAEVGEMLDYSLSILPELGYEPYYMYRQKFMSGGFENTGWCRSGTESIYNICIMEELCTILAMGGGASTKLVNAKTGLIERVFNAKYPLEYIESMEKITGSKERIKMFYDEGEIL